MSKNKASTSKPVQPQPIGDLVDVALKIADDQFHLEEQIKEAILANDDARLKVLAKQLVGLQ